MRSKSIRQSTKAISQIIKQIELRAPSSTAEKWDNVGLLVGDSSWKTAGAVVSIDLTEKAIQTAKAKGYRLILNHHPCIFPRSQGLSRVTSESLVFQALRAGIAVASYHTNFDRCALEVVSAVSEGLGIQAKGRLYDKVAGALVKFIVFVPSTHVDSVQEAICQAGAGQIGNYDFCTFQTHGEGTFRGGEATQPFLGTPGQLERANEVRLETLIPRGLETRVVQAMIKAHPYEEVAYDLIPVEQPLGSSGIVSGLGYGFWGEFPRAKSFSDVAQHVKSLFQLDGFWVTDPAPSRIRRVAFVAGKGSSFLDAAASLQCDLFITGEAGYHMALGGSRQGVAVMEIGHRESERFFLSTMSRWLTEQGLRSVMLNVPTQRVRTRIV